MIAAEYIWIDGSNTTRKLRSKTKILPYAVWDVEKGGELPELDVVLETSAQAVEARHFKFPEWGFDGSSTNQADGSDSDCILKPVRSIHDPFRNNNPKFPGSMGAYGHHIVLCEVLDSKGKPHKTNTRRRVADFAEKYKDQKWLFGMEQEYTLYARNTPLGWPERGPAQPQGKYYCGVGTDEVAGYELVEDHLAACLYSNLPISGRNAEVMPGQWEFQVGPAGPLEVADYLWLSRYLLYSAGIKYRVTVKLDSKPLPGWNGAGLHTNFSNLEMRSNGGIVTCELAAKALGEVFANKGFPKVYGEGYKERLTGNHETCSWEEFRYGHADRTASIRIPLHVGRAKKGYIEDRRPCASADPYEIVSYLMDACA